MLTLIEILKMRGLDTDPKRIKMVRHQHPPWDLSELIRRGQFDTYQWVQRKTIFHDCSFVVSFLGLEKSYAKLIGVYRIVGQDDIKEDTWPQGFLYPEMPCENNCVYQVEMLQEFNDLNNRLVIDWGFRQGPGING